MKKLILGLGVLTALTACNQAVSPMNPAVRGMQAPQTQFGRLAAGAESTGNSAAFARKLANPSAYKFTFEVTAASICGNSDDMQHVEEYNGSLPGFSKAYVDSNSPSVGALAMGPAGPNSRKFCSGTLISEDMFITASHCVDGDITKSFAVFNYQKAAGSSSVREQAHYAITGVVEDGVYQAAGGMDYAIIKLDGAPGKKFGFKKFNAAHLPVGLPVADVQHPSGKVKMFHSGVVAGTRGQNYVTYKDMDTAPGSSGSGVLNSNGELVAIHTNGGCSSSGGENAGVPVELIMKRSKVLQGLAR